uniref:Uncharacterized protein n=1 Tax=Trypanosoma vivax (strain Y486) TaxID=1055687 RepID=G0U567_TRYVY|nr:hypothetical protein TVY486_1000690 [Trypanosoma vivax Y486]
MFDIVWHIFFFFFFAPIFSHLRYISTVFTHRASSRLTPSRVVVVVVVPFFFFFCSPHSSPPLLAFFFLHFIHTRICICACKWPAASKTWTASAIIVLTVKRCLNK